MGNEMETFNIGFISGVVSVVAVGIFVWTITRGKRSSAGTLKSDIDRNNISTRQGLDRSKKELDNARRINTGLGNINRDAVEGIENTNRTVSEIIADAKRKRETDD